MKRAAGFKEGLMDLLEKDIKLENFSDENWQYLFNAAELKTDRQRRERDDKLILEYLEQLVPLDATKHELLQRKLINKYNF